MKTNLIVCLLLVLGTSVHAQTSDDTPRLKQALEKYPAADANKDGVLTLDEAKAFRDKNSGAGLPNRKDAKPAEAPAGGERHVYKTVGDVKLPLYVFHPADHKADAKSPAIVFFFGGGWSSGSPSQFGSQCKYLAARGMVAITVEYRVSSRHPVKVEDCVEDAKSALRWVREHAKELGIDPDRIASGGGSAGGHLAACTALIDDFNATSDNEKVSAKPNAMLLFNPFMGLATNTLVSQRTRGPAEKITPLKYASQKQPPCIMFFGTADGLLEGAKLFQQASEKAGNQCKLVTYEGQGHGFFNAGRNENKYYDLTVAEMDKFLVELGWLPAK